MSTHYGTGIARDGLVLYMDAANEKSYPGTGTTWYDLSGYDHNGTTYSGATFNNSVKAMDFDGVDDYVTISETAAMRPSILTVEMWCTIKSHTNTSYGGAPNNVQYVLFRQNTRTSNYEGYIMGYQESTQRYSAGATTSAGTQYTVIQSSGFAPIGTCSQVVVVFDTSLMSLYFNGDFNNSSVKAAGISYNTNHQLTLGRANPTVVAWDAAANCYLHNVKIYNRALTAAEIEQNFNAHRGRFGL